MKNMRLGHRRRGERFVRYIHSDDMLLPGLHSPRNFFVREVQARLIVCRVRPRPRQLFASCREFIG